MIEPRWQIQIHLPPVEPYSSNFRVITTFLLSVRIFRKFTVKHAKRVNSAKGILCMQEIIQFDLRHVTREPVFGVCDQVRLKPACSARETSWSLEILDLANIGIILSK